MEELNTIPISKEVLVEDLSSSDEIIVVVGPTGAGKSSFIETVTGMTGLAGHKLQSNTQRIVVIRTSLPELSDAQVCFVDTPGFDDTDNTDLKIFQELSRWIIDLTRKKRYPSGFVYLHRITDNRMKGTALTTVRNFQKLCCDEYKKIALITTMWDLTSETEGGKRETELQDKYWSMMIKRGSTTQRYQPPTRATAIKVLEPLFDSKPEMIVLPNSSTMTIIRHGRDVRESDKIIAIMGPTGSGKSYLIDKLTQNTMWSGDTLKSVTQKVRAIRIKSAFAGLADQVVLIDTPGFDDTTMSDLEVLSKIVAWLNETYERGVKLTGILYLHRISDVRMAGSPQRNLRMLGRLCGSEPAKRVIFVTTMWDRVPTDRGEEREKNLQKIYFKPMLDLGAHVARFMNTSDSAWNIISQLLKQREEEHVTLIQEEMVDMGRDLVDTAAAKELRSHMERLASSYKQTIEALKREAAKSNNQDLITILDKERADIQRQLEETVTQAQKLKIPLSKHFKTIFRLSKPKQKAVQFGEEEQFKYGEI